MKACDPVMTTKLLVRKEKCPRPRAATTQKKTSQAKLRTKKGPPKLVETQMSTTMIGEIRPPKPLTRPVKTSKAVDSKSANMIEKSAQSESRKGQHHAMSRQTKSMAAKSPWSIAEYLQLLQRVNYYLSGEAFTREVISKADRTGLSLGCEPNINPKLR